MSTIAFGMKGKMRPAIAPADARELVGQELFTTDWLELPENRVLKFRVGTFANEDDADMDQCLNYSMENVRFPAPVFLGDKVRVVCTLTEVKDHSKGTLITTHNVMELEGSDRPCLVADWTVLLRNVLDLD